MQQKRNGDPLAGPEVSNKMRVTVSDKPKPLFDRAAKKALAEERATEGAKAMSEAERAKTARLKAQRLAKEATQPKRAMKVALSPDDPLAKKKK